MSGIIGTGDGISVPTKAGFVKSGLDTSGGYDAPPPASLEPKGSNVQNQVGSTTLTNESGLRSALKARGFSDSDVDRQVAQHKASTGRR